MSDLIITNIDPHHLERMGRALIDVGNRMVAGTVEYRKGSISVDYINDPVFFPDDGRLVRSMEKMASSIRIDANILLGVK